MAALSTLSLAFISPASADSLDVWIQNQTRASAQAMVRNIAPPGTHSGVVVASPSRQNPNYYYHWIRDAGLVMDTVVTAYGRSQSQQDKKNFFALLANYTDFSRMNQLTPNPSGTAADRGLGEPRFNVDGSANTDLWGRPQNDGPAIRATALIRWARMLIAEGKTDLVRAKLYDGKIPTETVIKADLEFVAHHWREANVDLWEEVRGQHFYTRMVQRRALLEGAQLAKHLGDGGAAQFYLSQARLLEKAILSHWNPKAGYVMATLEWDNGKVANEKSHLDVAVILGVLHGSIGDGFLSPTNDVILATAERLRQAFKTGQRRYGINQRETDDEGLRIEAAIGRYPEDRYDGVHANDSTLGNPWFLATSAYAELYYRAGREWNSKGVIRVSPINEQFMRNVAPELGLKAGDSIARNDQRFGVFMAKLLDAADAFLRRNKLHVNGTSMSEQFNRNNGHMQGARDLTWSYASFLTAIDVRPKRNGFARYLPPAPRGRRR